MSNDTAETPPHFRGALRMANARAERWQQRHDAQRATLAGLLADVEALADRWASDDEESLNTFGQHLMGGAVLSCAEMLRATTTRHGRENS